MKKREINSVGPTVDISHASHLRLPHFWFSPALVPWDQPVFTSVDSDTQVLFCLWLKSKVLGWPTSKKSWAARYVQTPPLILALFYGPSLTTAAVTDLYRASIPAPYAARLPAHLLRLLPEGMVFRARIASAAIQLRSPLHLSVLPC